MMTHHFKAFPPLEKQSMFDTMFDYLANPSRHAYRHRLVPLVVTVASLPGLGYIWGWLFHRPIINKDTVGSSIFMYQQHGLHYWAVVGLGVCGLFYIVRGILWPMLRREPLPPLGSLFILTLVTGALWGKPMGSLVVWDARLTSMLILFFFYLGFIALANGFDRTERGSRPAALLALSA